MPESGPNTTFVLFLRLFNMPLRNNVFMPWPEKEFLESIIKFDNVLSNSRKN